MANSIRNSWVILWCITNAFLKSESCLDQIYFVIELKKPIIRLMFEDVDIGKLSGVARPTLRVVQPARVFLFKTN